MLDSSFWDDSVKANNLVGELKHIRNVINTINRLSKDIDSNIELIDMIGDNDIEILSIVEDECKFISKDMDNLELETYLSGEYDNCNAIVEIHAGAGGTESCDWANMLYRMYTRYAGIMGYNAV